MSQQSSSADVSPALAAPAELRCEYLPDPLGIDVVRPRFSWKLVAHERAQGQTAYQVIVATSREQLAAGVGDKWDSGEVTSDETIHIEYAGPAPASRERLYWAVRSWDRQGRATAYSEPAVFEMGLLAAADWQAQWIGAEESVVAPHLRKEFAARPEIAQARVYICGLGYYELHVNGQKIGDHVLDPNWTDFDQREMHDLLYPFDDRTSKRALYVTYDVTAQVQAGENAVGIILGNGWYNQLDRTAEGRLAYGAPRVLLQLEITYADGARETVVSDASWKCSGGPITHDNLFYGEVYDARREMPGWDCAGFADGRWAQAQVVRAPSGKLCAQMSPADKVMGRRAPVALGEPKAGVVIYDFGQNFTGWVRLKVAGPAGTTVTLRFAEEIHPDGTLDFASCGSERQIQQDVYTLKGGGEETYEPRFTWHGFRHVEVTGLPGAPALEHLEARVVHSAVESAGGFDCSNPLLNRIYQNYRWTQLSNYHGCVPSDCPHRERLGYTGDGHVTAESAMQAFAVPALYTKWVNDMGDGQNQVSGFVPHTVPFYGGGGGPGWGAAFIIVPWRMYEYYGDRRVLEQHYAGMQHWMEYLAKCVDEDGVLVREEPGSWCLGDWSFPVRTGIAADNEELPQPLVNTYFHGLCARLMARIATVLGRPDDAAAYAKVDAACVAAFNQRFFDEERGCYSINRHGSEAFALAFGAVPPDQRERVVASLLRNIEEHGGHFDTGIFGTPLMVQALTENGRTDLAYRMLSETSYPSFGYAVTMGATTLWEDWEEDKGSHCHPMFGSVCAWMVRVLAGLQVEAAAPAFRAFTVQPQVVEGLGSARAFIDTLRGRAASEWSCDEGIFKLRVIVPTGSRATVHLPVAGYANPRITETKNLLWAEGGNQPGIAGVTGARRHGDVVIVELEGGDYRFEVKEQGK